MRIQKKIKIKNKKRNDWLMKPLLSLDIGLGLDSGSLLADQALNSGLHACGNVWNTAEKLVKAQVRDKKKKKCFLSLIFPAQRESYAEEIR
jgi:hypothetical protein